MASNSLIQSGIYGVLDGLDGAGKGLVLEALKQLYTQTIPGVQSDTVEMYYTREPGGTDLSETLRGLILNTPMDPVTEFSLFLAQRKETRSFIGQLIKKGVSVISDRSDSSTFAFQIYGRRLHRVEDIFWRTRNLLEPNPDFYIFLDLPAEVAEERRFARRGQGGASDRIDSLSIDFHKRVQEGFRCFAEKSETECIFVDALPAPDVVAKNVITEVRKQFDRHFQKNV